MFVKEIYQKWPTICVWIGHVCVCVWMDDDGFFFFGGLLLLQGPLPIRGGKEMWYSKRFQWIGRGFFLPLPEREREGGESSSNGYTSTCVSKVNSGTMDFSLAIKYTVSHLVGTHFIWIAREKLDKHWHHIWVPHSKLLSLLAGFLS